MKPQKHLEYFQKQDLKCMLIITTKQIMMMINKIKLFLILLSTKEVFDLENCYSTTFINAIMLEVKNSEAFEIFIKKNYPLYYKKWEYDPYDY